MTEHDIAALIAQMTGIPVDKMLEGESEKLLQMEQVLHEKVVGQERAIEALSDAIRRARSGLKDPQRWLHYSGDYASQRHSPLAQITPQNVQRLVPQWVFQTETLGKFEATPILLDGVLYVTGPLAFLVDAVPECAEGAALRFAGVRFEHLLHRRGERVPLLLRHEDHARGAAQLRLDVVSGHLGHLEGLEHRPSVEEAIHRAALH
mgnify:CR=1 FL=1